MTGTPESRPRDPTQRFSDRVANYVRYRPDYPAGLNEVLAQRFGLGSESVVADLGAGTGILSAQLLDTGAQVLAVEPNHEMCAAAQSQLGARAGFRAVETPAEATGLDAGSVDGVLAAQAFHWFDVPAVRAEVLRIGRPGVWAAMIWNSRRLQRTAFLQAYEAFARTWGGSDYAKVSTRYAEPNALDEFFGGRVWERVVLDNAQRLDREGLQGRLASCSYIPGPGAANHAQMVVAADAMFDEHQQAGFVQIEYDTELYVGRLSP